MNAAAPLSRFTPTQEMRRDTSNEAAIVAQQALAMPASFTAGDAERHHESTLRTNPYTLTAQDFSHYSVSMDSELATLEEKVRQAAQLCQKLRDENRDLRQKLAAVQGDKKQLSEKIDGARSRLENILKQIPE
jgi:cell division protein ZapB